MDVSQDHRERPGEPACWSIRRATADDYDDIVALWSVAGLRICSEGRDSEQPFRRQLAHFGDLYLVATDPLNAKRIVGVVLGSHDHRKGWINRLAVHPDYRRTGVAVRLMSACDAAFRACGIEIVAALVEPDNAASFALFEKLGYRTDVPVRYYRKLSRPEA